MVALLGPVDAVAHQWPWARRYLDSHRAQPVGAACGELILHIASRAAQPVGAVAVELAVSAGQHVMVEQAAHDLHAEPPGDVVVAGPRAPQPRRPGTFA